MQFEKFFRLVSYAAVMCGFFSLWISGTFGVVGTGIFALVVVTAWLIEDTRWQIREVVGTALIVLALPAYYLAWRFQLITVSGNETVIAGILARMILSLTAVKLLQKKSDRDWIFLYLMSFFEVLLAAGLSISALYLASFIVYLLVMVCAIIAFEIRKTSRAVERRIAEDATAKAVPVGTQEPARRLPTVAFALIVIIIAVALPMFFTLPRVGGAGFGGDPGGLKTSSGFADTVKLGGIGRIQQSDEVAMRVKLEGHVDTTGNDLYFRGLALDTFDNLSWSRAKTVVKEPFIKGERDLVQVDYPASRESLSVQTIYLEPMDTPLLFALPRAVAVQGSFPVIYKDAYGSYSYQPSLERISYKVLSDRSLPPVDRLRADERPYTADVQNYRSLPAEYDLRIAELAADVTAGVKTRYDKARAVELYLQNNFGYTLEQKASGGPEPLSTFLFEVREGHCEYFATAMAIMLRTQGVATRIVNGFHGGEYNDTADVTIVRQRNAHAWVEVFFPNENVWVPFDPTPFGGGGGAVSAGIVGAVNKYIEAFETFWIQYFVAYDNQEQRSLARSVRNGLVDYQSGIATYLSQVREVVVEWWSEVRGDDGLQNSVLAIVRGIGAIASIVVGALLLVWTLRRIARLKIWLKIRRRILERPSSSVVSFYELLVAILRKKGMVRAAYQTPAEFAHAVGIPEAVWITEKYQAVRFGDQQVSADETREIEDWLKTIKTALDTGASGNVRGSLDRE